MNQFLKLFGSNTNRFAHLIFASRYAAHGFTKNLIGPFRRWVKPAARSERRVVKILKYGSWGFAESRSRLAGGKYNLPESCKAKSLSDI